MKTVPAHKLAAIRMVMGNEDTYSKVIDENKLMEWVGFGWIELRTATPEDFETYPVVIRGNQ